MGLPEEDTARLGSPAGSQLPHTPTAHSPEVLPKQLRSEHGRIGHVCRTPLHRTSFPGHRTCGEGQSRVCGCWSREGWGEGRNHLSFKKRPASQRQEPAQDAKITGM